MKTDISGRSDIKQCKNRAHSLWGYRVTLLLEAVSDCHNISMLFSSSSMFKTLQTALTFCTTCHSLYHPCTTSAVFLIVMLLWTSSIRVSILLIKLKVFEVSDWSNILFLYGNSKQQVVRTAVLIFSHNFCRHLIVLNLCLYIL